MRRDHGLPGAGAPRRLHHETTVTEQGLLLGDGTLLAQMADDGLCLEGYEERILTLLAVAYGRDVPAATLGSFRRAAKYWQIGDKCLAAIHLAQNGLGKIDAAGAYRLSLAAELIDAGVTPRELAQELGLRLPRSEVEKAGYDPNEPRVPAGSGRESGQWTSSGDDGTSGLTEGRSAATDSDKVHVVTYLPKNAIMVRRPDGSTIYDPASPIKRLMAPPRANFQEVYAAGEKIANWQIADRAVAGHAAVAHWGTYDFQRDTATNTAFSKYADAANYAVGVFMAGAGYGKWESVGIAQTWGLFFSSDKFDKNAREWTEKGWDDANRGDWKTQ